MRRRHRRPRATIADSPRKKKERIREKRSGPIVDAFFSWCDAEAETVLDDTPISDGIRYARNQRVGLSQFLGDGRLPIHNNMSELALRREALGRKNYLFVGDVAAGQSLAGLYSLVATCESRRLNPFDYLADVLARVQDHPASAIDELLPGAWAAAN